MSPSESWRELSAQERTDRIHISALRDAATVIETRTTKPGKFWVRVITRVLRDAADKIARGDWPVLR
jgi:hypothetical protein